MKVWQHSEWIKRPPEDVFDFFFDLSNAPRWRSFVRSMEKVGSDQPGPGTRYLTKLDVLGEELECEITLTALERPQLWRHRTAETDVIGQIEYRLIPDRNGTRVVLTGDAKPVTLYGWLSLPLALLSRGRAYREQLPRLKQLLETTPE
ncbi:MAG TPA: SRPBCC family protein [Longimicrobiales bacterium]|nr:SRPBCC family protein [Longimicrobiales bacterium]